MRKHLKQQQCSTVFSPRLKGTREGTATIENIVIAAAIGVGEDDQADSEALHGQHTARLAEESGGGNPKSLSSCLPVSWWLPVAKFNQKPKGKYPTDEAHESHPPDMPNSVEKGEENPYGNWRWASHRLISWYFLAFSLSKYHWITSYMIFPRVFFSVCTFFVSL